MSRDSLNSLSDLELHRKLVQSGFPNIPVTETTRPVLLEKLRKHTLSSADKRRRRSNKYVVYSDEPQDPPPPYPYPPYTAPANGIENNNDSDLGRPALGSSFGQRYNYNDDSEPNPLHLSPSKMYAPPPVLASNYDSDGLNCSPHALGKERLIGKERLPCPMPSYSSLDSYGKPGGKVKLSDGGVVNRLLSFRDATIQRKFNYPKVAMPAQGTRVPPRTARLNRFAFADLKSFFRNPDIRPYIIPQVLIMLFVIFLTIISVLYVSKRFDQSPLDKSVLKYTLCNPNDLQLSSDRVNCIGPDALKHALDMSEELIRHLNERARLHHCQDDSLSPSLMVSDFLSQLISSSKAVAANIHGYLAATKYLIDQNPQLMVQMVDGSAEGPYFELSQPSLPLKCIVLKKVARFFTLIGTMVLVVLAVLLVYFAVVLYRVRQKEALQAVDQFTNDIIVELIYQNLQSESPEVIIGQLQEKLLPAAKRRSKHLTAWNKALKQLEKNDSRVLFGMVNRDGKMLRTIAWKRTLDKKDAGLVKKWQSPAFDNSNKIANPPTPCLKIRHMFDASEVDNANLKQAIMESIIEKVGPRCKICDMQLDVQSCCVYLRCASEEDAGTIHDEINGWWFDRRLISIKFLRLERYLSRFPVPSAEPLYFHPSEAAKTHS
ncbi:hypothetical protein KR018_009541 [Drosophila ironensis]|nr:hypothetical protein KR018_009541 [Drosophila ironensis]